MADAPTKQRPIRLTPPMLALLTDLATKPQVTIRRYSRDDQSAQALKDRNLAFKPYFGEGGYYELKITERGLAEAIRRGLVPDPRAEIKRAAHRWAANILYGALGNGAEDFELTAEIKEEVEKIISEHDDLGQSRRGAEKMSDGSSGGGGI